MRSDFFLALITKITVFWNKTLLWQIGTNLCVSGNVGITSFCQTTRRHIPEDPALTLQK